MADRAYLHNEPMAMISYSTRSAKKIMSLMRKRVMFARQFAQSIKELLAFNSLKIEEFNKENIRLMELVCDRLYRAEAELDPREDVYFFSPDELKIIEAYSEIAESENINKSDLPNELKTMHQVINIYKGHRFRRNAILELNSNEVFDAIKKKKTDIEDIQDEIDTIARAWQKRSVFAYLSPDAIEELTYRSGSLENYLRNIALQCGMNETFDLNDDYLTSIKMYYYGGDLQHRSKIQTIIKNCHPYLIEQRKRLIDAMLERLALVKDVLAIASSSIDKSTTYEADVVRATVRELGQCGLSRNYIQGFENTAPKDNKISFTQITYFCDYIKRHGNAEQIEYLLELQGHHPSNVTSNNKYTDKMSLLDSFFLIYADELKIDGDINEIKEAILAALSSKEDEQQITLADSILFDEDMIVVLHENEKEYIQQQANDCFAFEDEKQYFIKNAKNIYQEKIRDRNNSDLFIDPTAYVSTVLIEACQYARFLTVVNSLESFAKDRAMEVHRSILQTSDAIQDIRVFATHFTYHALKNLEEQHISIMHCQTIESISKLVTNALLEAEKEATSQELEEALKICRDQLNDAFGKNDRVIHELNKLTIKNDHTPYDKNKLIEDIIAKTRNTIKEDYYKHRQTLKDILLEMRDLVVLQAYLSEELTAECLRVNKHRAGMIKTRDKMETLNTCIATVRSLTDYPTLLAYQTKLLHDQQLNSPRAIMNVTGFAKKQQFFASKTRENLSSYIEMNHHVIQSMK